jgi:3-dehydrosphinganine reductase
MTAGRWAGRHVIVTGGTSGIGLAATALLLAAGARVTAIGRGGRPLAGLAALAQPGLAVAAADVSEPEQLAAAIDAGRAAHGPAGALITCAGLVPPGYFRDLAEADLRRHLEVSYFGTVHAIRLTLPDLLRAEQASITCVSSAAGFLGVSGYSGPSKFAIGGLCEVLRQDLLPRGITVTVVSLDDADTPVPAAVSPERVARDLLAGTAAGRALVLPGAEAQALRWAAGTAPGPAGRDMDHAIARAAARAARP